MGKLYEVLSALCNEKGITGYRMCKDCGIQPSIMTDLKMGRREGLKAETATKIASYFGVTVDYLLTGEQKENPIAKSDEVTFDDFTYALHNQSKDLNDENKEKLLDMARMLKLAQDAQKNK